MVPWEESRHMHKIRIWFTAQGPPTASLVFVLNPSPYPLSKSRKIEFSKSRQPFFEISKSRNLGLKTPFSKSPKINFFKFFLFFFFFVR